MLERAVPTAREHCPSVLRKRVSPRVLRHTTAMHLLQAGVDLSVIALWLGHETIETTHGYLEADLQPKNAPSRSWCRPPPPSFASAPTTRSLASWQASDYAEWHSPSAAKSPSSTKLLRIIRSST
jgi:hypothetical protein